MRKVRFGVVVVLIVALSAGMYTSANLASAALSDANEKAPVDYAGVGVSLFIAWVLIMQSIALASGSSTPAKWRTESA